MSVVEVIESVFLFFWVCGTYVVHHFNGLELPCAPSTCIVHHRPALCTMVHRGDLLLYNIHLVVHNIALSRSGGTQDNFAC